MSFSGSWGIMEYMKQFSAGDVKRLATLSGLNLTDDEARSLGADLESIIKYVDKLDELDVDGVEPTYQLTDLVNVFRGDEVAQGEVSREQLLALAPDSSDSQIRVPKVL